MLKLYFEQVSPIMIKMSVKDDITLKRVMSCVIPKSRYENIYNYINESNFRFGSIYIEPFDTISSCTILFFNDEKFLKICHYSILKKYACNEIIINYNNIEFIQ